VCRPTGTEMKGGKKQKFSHWKQGNLGDSSAGKSCHPTSRIGFHVLLDFVQNGKRWSGGLKRVRGHDPKSNHSEQPQVLNGIACIVLEGWYGSGNLPVVIAYHRVVVVISTRP